MTDDKENGIRISHSFPGGVDLAAIHGQSPRHDACTHQFPAKLADGKPSGGTAAIGAHMTQRTRLRLIVLAAGSTLLTPLHAAPVSDSYLAMPVMLDDDASGVYIQHRDSVYFVTARRALFDPNSAKPRKPRVTLSSFTKSRAVQEPILFELDLATLTQSHRILSSEASGLAAVRIGDVTSREDRALHWNTAPGVTAKTQRGPVQIILGAEEWRRFEEAEVGNDVLLAATEQLERGRPLLLEGTLARKDRSAKRLIVVVRVSPRNMGGPVIEIAEAGQRWEPNFIGIVIERLRRKPSFDDSEQVVVASVDAILRLIEHP